MAIVAAAFAAEALAHGTVSGFKTDGVYNRGYLLQDYYTKANGGALPDTAGWYAENLDNGFISPDAYTTSDIVCHKNSAPGAITATVAAGGTVDFQWTVWPDSHIGPILTYVAKCDADCADADKTSLLWVKIDEAAIDLTSQEWPIAAMIANNNTYTVTVPSTLAAGNYVFRHEIIAMHGAGSENGAQNYPQCVNIAITGSGTDSPVGVLGTALYTPTDPGILFNPYTTLTSYTIPGPALYSGGTSSTGSSSGSSASSAPTTTASAAASKTTSKASASATATSAVTVSAASGEDSACGSSTRRRHARDMTRRGY